MSEWVQIRSAVIGLVRYPARENKVATYALARPLTWCHTVYLRQPRVVVIILALGLWFIRSMSQIWPLGM